MNSSTLTFSPYMTLALIGLFAFFSGCTKRTISIATDQRKLVWSDEFDYTGKPDTTKWAYDIGGHGWGNQELQYYTDRTDNARVENGKLLISCKKETFEDKAYTSARLVTKGKASWIYGRFEIRAKLPDGLGTWPAIWMLADEGQYGAQYWPHNGEIDIMEHVGFDQGVVHASVHTLAFHHSIGTQKTAKMPVPTASTDFHIYSVDWTPDTITASIDGKAYFVFSNDKQGWEHWPFDKPFHLLLNIAFGGFWGGAKGVDPQILPKTMEVDWVRVYQ